MAAFACFTNSNEKTTSSYTTFIQRLQQETKQQLGDKPIYCAANFHYYNTYKDRLKQYVFKEFIYHLRMKMLSDETSILICGNLTPTFKGFVRLVERLKAPDDSLSTTAYYGEIRNIIIGFMNYYTFVIDETEKKLDKYMYLKDSVRNQLLLDAINNTIAINEENQAAFLEEYLPLNTELEKENYQQVIDAHAKYLAGLSEMKATWETKQNKLEIFMKDIFETSFKKIAELCKLTHTYIAMMLEDRLFEITKSITETATRLNCNLRKCREEFTVEKNVLFQNLYEKNKEYMNIYRRSHKESNVLAEVNKTIDLLKHQITSFGHEETIARLELETRYWNKRLKEFNEIASVLVRIRYELDYLNKEMEEHNRIKCAGSPGSMTKCFASFAENIEKKMLYYKEKQLEMSKALITFFCVKGTDHTLYKNRTGDSFYIDEFNHQNYIKHYGMKYYHTNCYGDYLEHSENRPYYFDQNGRYTFNESGEKIYQAGPCTSMYKLDENELFTKITEDCGHSEKYNPDCLLAEIQDKICDRVILPKIDPVDMTGTLDTESVEYLWDNYGMILSEVLSTVATERPKNPIHLMGHLLLKRKFEASPEELRNYKKMGQKYRKDIQEKRLDKKKMEIRAWEAKLMKRKLIDADDDPYVDTQSTTDLLIARSMGYY